MAEIHNASFIKPVCDMGTAAPVFRKCFSAENVKKATLEITSRGTFCAYLNGKRIGDFVLAPGWTEYKQRLQYEVCDITDLIENENEFLSGVGLGWFFDGSYKTTHSDLALCAALIIEKTDGTVQKIYTDNTWQYCTGHTLYDNIYNGETYDANKEITVLGFVAVCESFSKNLIPRQGEKIKENERIAAERIFVTPNNETVIDFGQNLTGYVEFNACGKKGDTLLITHAEVLDKNGNFYTANYRSAKNEIRFICDGNRHLFKPHYTFQGFRYIRLEGFSADVRLNDFTAVAVYSDIKRTGHFSCSNELLNTLYRNIVWGQKSNFLDIPTDCPQRDERLGWTGDAQVFVRTASYNFDVERFFTKWLADVSLAQSPDGRIPHVVPSVHWWNHENSKSSAAWGDAAVICPWQIYLTYGNADILKNQFSCMKKWVDYISAESTGFLWLNGEHFGDWLGLDAQEGSYKGITSPDLIASAYFAYSTSLLIKAGKALGMDMREYERLFEKIKSAYIKRFLSPDGKMLQATQTACAVTLYFDLCDNKSEVAAQLNDLVLQKGSLTTGFVGTPYLLHALSENGYAQTAYSLLLREKYPSWLYPVTKGATTMWEHWDGIKPDGSMWSDDMNSFNHYAYGAVYDWMFGVAAGIKPDENAPGFKRFTLSPVTDKRLQFAEASLITKHGKLSSGWRHENGNITYYFTVPHGTEAVFTANGEPTVYGEGSYTVISAESD